MLNTNFAEIFPTGYIPLDIVKNHKSAGIKIGKTTDSTADAIGLTKDYYFIIHFGHDGTEYNAQLALALAGTGNLKFRCSDANAWRIWVSVNFTEYIK